MVHEEKELNRDCPATLIPAGDSVMLPAGTRVFISQALGGTVTVRVDSGLFRIGSENLDALGADVAEAVAAEEQASKTDGEFSTELVWDALRTCFDPEIPINIVDLGLIYDLCVKEEEGGAGLHTVAVKMTLTAQGCGMGPAIAEDARSKIVALSGVKSAQVDIVWDPVWTPQMISPEGRKKLGIE